VTDRRTSVDASEPAERPEEPGRSEGTPDPSAASSGQPPGTGEVYEPTDEEVVGAVDKVAKRLAEKFRVTFATAREVADALMSDDAARDVLAAAFLEGREDKQRELLARGGATLRPEPDWSDVQSVGERALLAREESACGTCGHAGVCSVPRASTPPMLVVVSRCASYHREDAPVRTARPMR